MAAAQTAALENGASVCCGHSLAEAVHAHATANFRLISTFRHCSFLTLKILLLY
jgi:hypothetical protein